MLPALTPSHWLSLHGLSTVTGLLVYVVVSHVLQAADLFRRDWVFAVGAEPPATALL